MRRIAPAVAFALAVVGCGDTAEVGTSVAPTEIVEAAPTTVAPSATSAPAATQAPASSSTAGAAATGPTEVAFTTDDGLTLEATALGNGNDWVVLTHMRPADKSSWLTFAELLAAEGYTALAFNFRGYGASEGDGFDVEADTVAAIDFARSRGADRVFVIGASMGGTGSLAAAALREVAGVATLSAPAVFEGADGLTAVPSITAPKLFVAGDQDADYADIAAELAAAAADPREVVVYQSNEHGTNLFRSNGEELTALLLEFLAGA